MARQKKSAVEKAIDKAVANIDGIDSESTSYATERASIEAALADKKTAAKLVNWPPSRGPMPRRLREESKMLPAKIKIEMLPEGAPPLVGPREKVHEFNCDLHFKSLATLSLLQADRVIDVVDENGCCGLLIGSSTDFLPRQRCSGGCKGTSGKRKKLTPPTVVVDLRYPLSRLARVTIPPFRWYGPSQSWGHILWQISKAYKQVYKEWKRFGVWGHGIDDLWCEGVAATADGRLVLHVGS